VLGWQSSAVSELLFFQNEVLVLQYLQLAASAARRYPYRCTAGVMRYFQQYGYIE